MQGTPNHKRLQTGRTALEGGLAAVALAALSGLLILLAVDLFADSFPPEPWGYDTPAADCVVCHSLEKGGPFRVAPNLWGIVGDEKARDRAWYAYSPALIRVGGTWSPEELDRFLENAAAFAPGSTKSIRVADPQQREDIIAFLGTLDD